MTDTSLLFRGRSTPADFDVRDAIASDIPSIAHILVDTWHSTFQGLLSAAFLDGMSVDFQIKRYEKILQRPQVFCHVVVDNAQTVIGFCCSGPNRSKSVIASSEVYALYVLKSHHRLGLGRKLFEEAARRALSKAGSGLCVWVIASNPSRAFYEHMGGVETALGDVTLGDDSVAQVAYTWRSSAFRSTDIQ